jgi:hypothetical protein
MTSTHAARVPRLILAALASTLFAGTLARADVIVQERSVTDLAIPFADSASLAFDRFDTLGGTRALVAVELRLEHVIKTQVSIPIPRAGTTVTVRVGSEAEPVSIDTSLPFGLPADPSNPAVTSFVSSQAPIEVSLSSSASAPFSQTWITTATSSFFFTADEALALFNGTDPFTLLTEGLGQFRVFGATGPIRPTVSLLGDVRATLLYDFEPNPIIVEIVPEPASLLGLAGGLATLLAIHAGRRRR